MDCHFEHWHSTVAFPPREIRGYKQYPFAFQLDLHVRLAKSYSGGQIDQTTRQTERFPSFINCAKALIFTVCALLQLNFPDFLQCDFSQLTIKGNQVSNETNHERYEPDNQQHATQHQ